MALNSGVLDALGASGLNACPPRAGRVVTQTFLEPESIAAFSESARKAVYEAIALRRDVRHFRPGSVLPEDVLERILGAGHLAPSVGFSQPWGFVVVRERAVRERIRESFLRCREAEAQRFPEQKRQAYLSHRLEGILESSLNLCVAVDLRGRDGAILGTTAQPEAVRASACCAVQNLWLAARAEGIGIGWVSIVEPAVLREELGLPPGVEPIAYLCVGEPIAFRSRPMLEETGWGARRPLGEAVHAHGRWDDGNGSPGHASEVVTRPSGTQTDETAWSGGKAPLSGMAHAAAMRHQALLTKPVGSLGRLEELAAWYAAVRGAFPPPALERVTVTLFAADHGVVTEGVSAYGSQTTAAVVANVMAGGAAINALATSSGADIRLIDVGVAGDLSACPTEPLVPLVRRPVRAGTANLRRGPAMTPVEMEAAMAAGEESARAAIAHGAGAIVLGEIGIGNTTAAAALVAWFTGAPPAEVVGGGTGVSDAVRARKIQVVEEALALHCAEIRSPLEALARLGGLEIAAMAGALRAAVAAHVPVVLDGFVTNAAALVAQALDPSVIASCIAGHRSPEPGARHALERLGLRPVLDLEMRLGEGTGGVLAASVLRAAVTAQSSMATFATAGIVGRAGTAVGSEPRGETR